jgi:hypothetical protein
MKSLFSLSDEALTDGYLLIAQYCQFYHGTLKIYKYDTLIVGPIVKPIIDTHRTFTLWGYSLWMGSQEPASWNALDRNVEPPDRYKHQGLYMRCALRNLDIIPTSNGSRFLSLKKVIQSKGKQLDRAVEYEKSPLKEEAYVFEDINDFSKSLFVQLSFIGVPLEDKVIVRTDIKNKIR